MNKERGAIEWFGVMLTFHSALLGASKRVSTKQKAKISKKVKEHTRKSKRTAKKDSTWKSKKKVDPGIPNSYPYKEQLLNEIEQKRIAVSACYNEPDHQS